MAHTGNRYPLSMLWMVRVLICLVTASVAACTASMADHASGWQIPTAVHELHPAGAVRQIPFVPATGCSGAFVPHTLANTSLSAPSQGVRMFNSNGSGVALGDLNGDYLLDIALANLSEPNAILWNQGHLRFARMELAQRDTRAAAMVDVDGDSMLDVVFTQRLEPPVVYLNQAGTVAGNPRSFSMAPLPGVNKTAYSMAWFDVDGDGDLDLATGSYDLELQMLLGEAFKGQTRSGAYWHENRDFRFHSHLLTRRSQALALAIHDLQGDARPVLIIGNDFLLEDSIWKWTDGQWHRYTPFTVTTQNTMSFSLGDVNNDGRLDLFAADMKPWAADPDTLAAWQPVANKVLEDPADRQIVENVLQWQGGGEAPALQNRAQATGVEATGWTWSTQFADFDQDGFLDLYAVNGMNARDLFSHLPDNELIETNWAFRNEQGERFVPAPEWRMDLRQGGRGMSIGDVDFDGDLDAVINNLLEATVLLENQLCQGASIQVHLRDLQTSNTHGIGARLILHTDAGSQMRVVKAASGYLSGLPPTVHFGFPRDAVLSHLEIIWPDGTHDTLHDIQPHHLYEVIRIVPSSRP